MATARSDHREFPMASGEMSEFQFISFLTSSLKLLARYSTTGSVHFVCMDWRHIGELLTAGKQEYDSLLNVCVWVKNNGGMGSFYRSRHEMVFVFRNGKGKHRNNIQLGQYGRNRTNVWEYPSINSISKSGDEGNLLALHPTVKPVAIGGGRAARLLRSGRLGAGRIPGLWFYVDCGRADRAHLLRNRT